MYAEQSSSNSDQSKQPAVNDSKDTVQEKSVVTEPHDISTGPTTEVQQKQEDPTISSENDSYLRLYATFDNYKKRIQKEKSHWISYANRRLVKDLLPIIDDFELAFIQKNSETTTQATEKGIELIYKKLCQLLEKEGLKAIKTAIGDTFDADRHEALSTLPTEEQTQKNTIAQVIHKGYTFQNQMIRSAKVIVYI